MRAVGVTIPRNGPFRDAQAILRRADAAFPGEFGLDLNFVTKREWRAAFSLADLAEKVVAVMGHPDFLQLKGHLDLLAQTHDLSQFSETPREQNKNDYVFELWASAALMRITTDCLVEPINGPASMNPDFLGTHRNRRWGFALKSPHSTHPEGLIEHTKKAISQIEKSLAACGIVFFNGKNLIEHDDYWFDAPLDPSSRPTPDQLTAELESYHRHIVATIWARCSGRDFDERDLPTQADLDRGADYFWSFFDHKRATLPCVLLVLPTATVVWHEGAETISIHRRLYLVPGPNMPADAKDFVEALNASMQGRD